MAERTPQEGAMANGGPFNGRILAFDKMVMPVTNNTGKRVGSYYWMDEHWEYEKDDSDIEEIYL